MPERLFILIQHLLPKLAFTRLLGWAANSEARGFSQWLIRHFITHYQVNMAEAEFSDPSAYTSFNAFFTRPLKAGARPLANTPLICPVDGTISQLGTIQQGEIFQAKGKSYTTQALLAGDAILAQQFTHGQFATIYLSPRDYHRVHMPRTGRLLKMTYVPGTLYSVNPATARGVDALFARNERVICHFDSTEGEFVLVLVGALVVGSMATVWHGVVNPPRAGQIQHWDYHHESITLQQGEEMGRFLLGSTVVMLFPPSPLSFNPTWQAAKPVRLGEEMAN